MNFSQIRYQPGGLAAFRAAVERSDTAGTSLFLKPCIPEGCQPDQRRLSSLRDEREGENRFPVASLRSATG